MLYFSSSIFKTTYCTTCIITGIFTQEQYTYMYATYMYAAKIYYTMFSGRDTSFCNNLVKTMKTIIGKTKKQITA